MSTNDETNETSGAVVVPATAPVKKAPAAKKAAKPKAKPAAKPVAKVAAKTSKKSVKKVAAKKVAKTASKKNGKAKAPSQRGKGPANLRNELHKLLLKKLPEKFRIDKESLDFAKIAKAHNMTIEGVYKWFRVDRITPIGAMNFVKIGESKLKLADFHPFVFKK